MELKDFIQEALTQIIDGIKSCQHENILEASINPSGVIYSDNLGMETEIKGTAWYRILISKLGLPRQKQ